MRQIVAFVIVVSGVLAPGLARADKTYNMGKGGTWDCAKDDGVTINANNGTYTFKGACNRISVNGNNNKLTIATAKSLDINGNNNTAALTSVDSIQTNGNNNHVTYKKGSPNVSNPGSHNTISGGDAKPPEAKPNPQTDVKPSANAVDCAKNPKYAITSGNGTYAFTGTCAKISIAGGENTVTIENVKELAVAGSKNTITVGAADKIAAIGSSNSIKYKKGLSGAKPKVSAIGQNNKIEQVK
jgi:Protein of unknown function (DUF3060)